MLALFAEIERMPQRGQQFKDRSRELARLLGLTSEWWTGNSVNDRSAEPCHPEGHVAREDWFRCRDVRDALLVAVAKVSDKPTSHGLHFKAR